MDGESNPVQSPRERAPGCKACGLLRYAPDSRVRGERIVIGSMKSAGRSRYRACKDTVSVLKQGGTAKFSFAPAIWGGAFLWPVATSTSEEPNKTKQLCARCKDLCVILYDFMKERRL